MRIGATFFFFQFSYHVIEGIYKKSDFILSLDLSTVISRLPAATLLLLGQAAVSGPLCPWKS